MKYLFTGDVQGEVQGEIYGARGRSILGSVRSARELSLKAVNVGPCMWNHASDYFHALAVYHYFSG